MKKPFTAREEANALICTTLRHGYLEQLHGGDPSPLLEQPGLSRITNAEMKKLMIEVTSKLAELLELKESNPYQYWLIIKYFHEEYCGHWEK